jgi:hypothetical protein
MIQLALLYLGAAFSALWGVAHLFPTRSVVAGFGKISLDNQRIITMEWITEGVSLIFMGAVVGTVTYIDVSSAVSRAVYGLTAIGLLALAGVSVFTGYRVSLLPYKLCPFIFAASALMILAGGVL